jgi:phosphoribosylaminoimidazolecarboxamide formyltransferase / IMP cyclohydrolase
MERIRIRRALLSVWDKTGIVELARGLVDAGAEIVSSGGTARDLQSAGIDVLEVSELTGSPEMLDGRVKTLHPRVHGGILADRSKPEHLETLSRQGIVPIDLVVVNLYPFDQEVTADTPDAEAVELIDVGGPSMVRAVMSAWYSPVWGCRKTHGSRHTRSGPRVPGLRRL